MVEKLIIDMTKADTDTVYGLLLSARQRYSIPAEDRIVLVKNDQRAFLGTNPPENVIVLPDGEHYTAIASKIYLMLLDLLRRNEPRPRVLVLTFHPAVFALRDGLMQSEQGLVDIRPLSVVKGTSLDRSPSDRVHKTDAAAIVRQALLRADASSREKALNKSVLRLILAGLDGRLRAKASIGVIEQLLQAAVRSGAVSMDHDLDSQDPRYWADPSIAADASPECGVSREGSAERPGVGSIQGAGVPPESNSVTASPEPIVEELALKSATAAVPKPRKPKADKHQEILDALKSKKLGPFSRIRPFFYAALEQSVPHDDTEAAPKVSDVLAESTNRAFELCEAEGRAKDLARQKVRDFFKHLLAKCPVLVGDNGNEPMAYSTTTLWAPVHKLTDNWQRDLDGQLVLGLLESGVNLGYKDAPDLAGALFLDREQEHKANELLRYLLDEKRLRYDETKDVFALPERKIE